MNIEQRIKVEAKIVRRVIRELVDAGYSLSVYDLKDSTKKKEVFGKMMVADEEVLTARKGSVTGRVLFVYGNDGYDVIANYATNLAPVMDIVLKYVYNLEMK